MMRILLTEGYGNEAREGSHVTVHWTVSTPGDDGALMEVYNTEDKFPRGIKFTIGRTTYCEAVERALVAMKPGSVLDCFCTDMEAASCPELGFKATRLPEGAKKVWWAPGGPIGVLQGALDPPPMISRKEEDVTPMWQARAFALLMSPIVVPLSDMLKRRSVSHIHPLNPCSGSHHFR